MIGSEYWTTGITVRYGYSGGGSNGWGASLDFYDDGFAEDDSTQGTLATRYFARGDDALTRALDTLKADAERLGIQFVGSAGLPPGLWYTDDLDFPAPAGWYETLSEQADRIGFRTHHSADHVNAPA
jgi:hypothetical protein